MDLKFGHSLCWVWKRKWLLSQWLVSCGVVEDVSSIWLDINSWAMVVEDFLWQQDYWSYLSSRAGDFLFLDNVKAFLGCISTTRWSYLGYCLCSSSCGISLEYYSLQLLGEFDVWFLFLTTYSLHVNWDCQPPRNLSKLHWCNSLDSTNNDLDLEMCNWMEKREGSVWFWIYTISKWLELYFLLVWEKNEMMDVPKSWNYSNLSFKCWSKIHGFAFVEWRADKTSLAQGEWITI